MVGGVGVVTAWRCSVLSGMGAGVKVDRGKRRRARAARMREERGTNLRNAKLCSSPPLGPETAKKVHSDTSVMPDCCERDFAVAILIYEELRNNLLKQM